MKNSKIKLIALATMIALPLLTNAQEDRVIATVNGEELTSSMVQLLTADNDQIPPQEVLRSLIIQTIVAQEAAKSGYGDDELLKRALRVREIELLSGIYVDNYFKNTEVSDSEIEAEYATFIEKATGSKEYRARHILVDDEEQAKEIIKDVGNDLEKFAAAASEFSKDPGSGANGGELGWSPAEAYVPEFGEALRSLETGGATKEPLQTQFGWHIVLLEETRDVTLPELVDLRDQLAENILRLKFRELLDTLQEAAGVESTTTTK